MEQINKPKTWEEFVIKHRDFFEQLAKTLKDDDEYPG